MPSNRCKQCNQPLVEIDHWGERLALRVRTSPLRACISAIGLMSNLTGGGGGGLGRGGGPMLAINICCSDKWSEQPPIENSWQAFDGIPGLMLHSGRKCQMVRLGRPYATVERSAKSWLLGCSTVAICSKSLRVILGLCGRFSSWSQYSWIWLRWWNFSSWLHPITSGRDWLLCPAPAKFSINLFQPRPCNELASPNPAGPFLGLPDRTAH
jgi:hypothetical protein